MNPREQEDSAFDRIADDELRALDRALSSFDPDEVESDIAGDVMTVTVLGREKVVVNRHRAARQIWMAALRRAWHFDHAPSEDRWRTASGDELRETLGRVLSEVLGRPVRLGD